MRNRVGVRGRIKLLKYPLRWTDPHIDYNAA